MNTFTFVLVLLVGLLVLMLVVTAGQNRRRTLDRDRRLCRGCGQPHPPHAAFCARCGKKLT